MEGAGGAEMSGSTRDLLAEFEAGKGNTAPTAPALSTSSLWEEFEAAQGAQKSTSSSPKPSPKIAVSMPGLTLFEDPKDTAAFNEGQTRSLEKVGEGATMGLLPYGIAAARWLAGTPFEQGLREARGYTAQTSRDMPTEAAVAEGIGSLAPGIGFGGLARGGTTLAGRALRGARAGGAFGGANEAGHAIGMGRMSEFVPDVTSGTMIGAGIGAAGPLVGALLQAPVNMIRGGAQAVRNIGSSAGRDAIAGQVLREAAGDFQGTTARSPLPGLELRTAQATGNPGLAALERTVASEPGASGTGGGLVQNGRTPDQVREVAKALVGTDAGVEPRVLTNQSSARGTGAIRAADDALDARERALWQAPELQGLRFNSPQIARSVAQDVARFPASWRDAVTGPQGKLGVYLRELAELGPGASLQDLNSIRSRILRAGRDAGAGAAPDSVTAAAAGELGQSILRRIEADPALAGGVRSAAPGFSPGLPGIMPSSYPRPGAPVSAPPNQAAIDAYQAARDFSRQYHTTLGYPEFNAVLNTNRAGNIVANDETAFGRFFDANGGTGAGAQRLQALSDLLRRSGNEAAANELDAAARAHIRAALLAQGRAGAGLDPTGNPAMNLASTASAVNRSMPTINAAPMLAAEAPQIQAAGNAAELLNRPSTLRADNNSTTFEKLRNRELVSAILGQAGSSGTGAIAGGYAGSKYGPDATPGGTATNALIGALTGAAMGQRAGPFVGRTIGKIPGVNGMVAGPTQDIMRRIASGLASPEEFQRLVALELAAGPSLGQRGNTSALAEQLLRMAIPGFTREGGAR